MRSFNLQKYVENVSLEYFNRPFTHKATFNKRLRTTGGRYYLKTHHLDFNPLVYEQLGEDVFLGIVKHELCHYHLHLLKQGYRHKDKDFKQLLKEVGGLRYTPRIENEDKQQWTYQCQTCGTIIYRQRRFQVEKYRCANCKGIWRLIKSRKIKI